MPQSTVEELKTIEEILTEANAYGLRQEVQDWADKIMDECPEGEELDAYILAFEEWIK